ncbi:NYN domain-containing protein [Stenotrophomonas maltophilia]|uniref:NYN domain-containing protein n=1 Tax=Stenotrophomonas maltophilia TaxID=40324 RepID=UPI00066DB9E6|nr:NYN domain-containing protein [Stenotrophomonas maltophilia]ELK2667142.1 NYN domain-containing protein [Stenotrophomonas maltophilia]KUJ04816.1 NYN domain-containing protein [Stenotrophomonas maltophilia]MBH1378034.1 NYN domain-containing protein [Stenotrophomonas maltophilia]MBH1440807.1 NYN domain-containing protein [Stenotrophomonas maltophilia]MBH1560781.1 NYN domain-containing protein [Stenotrophomonas maltophilia]
MPTAVLIDGGYFVKRFRRIEPHNAYNPERAAELAHRWALAHLTSSGCDRRDLYRIFFYDCPPLRKRMHNPISGVCIDYARSPEALFRVALHDALKQKRKVALRLGHLADSNAWTTDSRTLDALLKGKRTFSALLPSELHPEVRQKGVDMRIGLDISSLSLKRQVRQIVLVAGDSDFIPAAKLARREGVDFVLDPMWSAIPPGLLEHIDGVRSTCPRPAFRHETWGAKASAAGSDQTHRRAWPGAAQGDDL